MELLIDLALVVLGGLLGPFLEPLGRKIKSALSVGAKEKKPTTKGRKGKGKR